MKREPDGGRPARRHGPAYDAVFFVALLATALALGGALAHLLELPNKIGLAEADYFTVQQIYRGWSQLGYLLGVELVSIVALIVMSRHERGVMWPAAVALAGLVCAQAVFWIFTFPANVATENWTAVPENWEALRRQWEYSHAVGAAFQTVVMAALIIAALRRHDA